MTDSDRPPQASARPKWIVALVVILLLLLVGGAANLWINIRLLAREHEESREHAFWVLCQPGYSMKARKAAFLLLMAQGNREWRSASLTDLDLEKGHFAGAQLEGAAFPRAKLAQADLSNANLKKASFE